MSREKNSGNLTKLCNAGFRLTPNLFQAWRLCWSRIGILIPWRVGGISQPLHHDSGIWVGGIRHVHV